MNTKFFLIFVLMGLIFQQGISSSKDWKSTKNSFDQEILFHFSYINWAWGYQHEGWFIDSLGIVKFYKNESPSDWYFPEDGYITEIELAHNYSLANTVQHEIERDQLYAMYQLIDAAACGSYSERINTGADMGAFSYYYYWWDESRYEFKQVLLSETGDCSQYNLDSNAIILDNWLKSIQQIIVRIEKNEASVATKFALSNYPNPFNAITKISYSIPNSSFITLKIYDLLCREVQTLVNEFQKANTYIVDFEANGLSSGIYFYRLQVERDFIESKKMLFLK